MTEETKAAATAAAERPAVSEAPPSDVEVKDDSAIWAEFQEADDKPEGDKPEEHDDEPPLEAASDGSEPAGSEQPQKEEPASAKPVEAETPEQRAAAAALVEKNKLEQRIRSDTGRLEALQRRIAAAQAQPSREEKSARDELAGLQDDYPEIAAPLSKVVEKIDGTLERLTKAEKASLEADQAELKQIVETQTQTLEEKHPDWFDVLSKNGPAFKAWVDDQPLRIREAARRNDQAIYDAQAAIEVVQGFKTHLGLISDAGRPQPQTPPKLDDRRQRQIEGTSSPQRSGSRPTVSGIPAEGDPEQIWKAFDDMDAAKAARSA